MLGCQEAQADGHTSGVCMSNVEGFFIGTEMPNTGWWGDLWPDPANVLQRVGLKADANAVDLWCGDGWFTLPMSRVAAHVNAIDIDPALVEATRQRLRTPFGTRSKTAGYSLSSTGINVRATRQPCSANRAARKPNSA